MTNTATSITTTALDPCSSSGSRQVPYGNEATVHHRTVAHASCEIDCSNDQCYHNDLNDTVSCRWCAHTLLFVSYVVLSVQTTEGFHGDYTCMLPSVEWL